MRKIRKYLANMAYTFVDAFCEHWVARKRRHAEPVPPGDIDAEFEEGEEAAEAAETGFRADVPVWKPGRKSPTKAPACLHLSPELTVAEARRFVEEHRTDSHGANCPVCDQLVKVYRRRLNTAMALVLIYLVRRYDQVGALEWVHVPTFIRTLPIAPTVPVGNGGDWSKMRFWGFIEPQPGDRGDGSTRNGFYQLTERGIAFARGQMKAPASVYITNQQVLGVDEKLVDIHEALGKQFRYDELMTAV